jgi:hypothetical protein
MKGMATLIVLLFALATAQSPKSRESQYSVLAIQYVGISDKPVFPIIISDSKTGAEWYRTAVLKRSELHLTYEHVVDAALMANLISEAELYCDAAQKGLEPKSTDRETVSTTLVTAGNRRAFLLNTKSAVSLLEKLKNHCSSDISLYSDLQEFQDRIRPCLSFRSKLEAQAGVMRSAAEILSEEPALAVLAPNRARQHYPSTKSCERPQCCRTRCLSW